MAYDRGDLQTARQNFNKALGRSVKFIGTLYYLGLVYEKLGQPDQAAEYFRLTMQSPDIDQEGLKQKAAIRLKVK